MENFPEELTPTDYRFLHKTSQGKPNNLMEEDEQLDWPPEIDRDKREAVIRKLRNALRRWANAGGETVGEDYIVINKEEVDGGTLTATISIHNLAVMFAKLILRLETTVVEGYRDYLGTGISPSQITLQDFARYSEQQAYGLEEYILEPGSFFSFLIEHS